MKELFRLNDDGVFSVEEEGHVYSVWSLERGQYVFYNACGQVLPDYRRPTFEGDDCEYEEDFTDDPEQATPVVNGFYAYTTHEVQYDSAGEMFGCFGIKDRNGRVITAEIYHQIGYFSGGACPVRMKGTKWGCVDTQGQPMLPYQYSEPPQFNLYGVAVGDGCLIDTSGAPLADTALNSVGSNAEADRYFEFSLFSDDQMRSIEQCGTAPRLTVDIYDTKERRYVVKGIPDCKLNICSSDVAPEVILQAADMLSRYDRLSLHGKGTIVAVVGTVITVFDYYQ